MAKHFVSALGSAVTPGAFLNLAAMHPVFGVIAAAGALIYSANAAVQYKDYATNAEEAGMAIGMILDAPDDCIASLNRPVAGALLRFLKDSVISQFNTRIQALQEIYDGDSSDVEVSERMSVYGNGLSEAKKLDELLTITLKEREDEHRINIQKTKYLQKQAIEELQNKAQAIRTRYQAGLMSHDEFSKLNSELRSAKFNEDFEGFASAAKSHVKNSAFIGGAEKTLKNYADKVFESYGTPGVDGEGKSHKMAWMIGIILIIMVVLYFLFQGQDATQDIR